MARLEGQKTKPVALIAGAIFILVVTALFLSLRSSGGPKDIPASNSAPPQAPAEDSSQTAASNVQTPVSGGGSSTPAPVSSASADAATQVTNSTDAKPIGQENTSTNPASALPTSVAPLPTATSAPAPTSPLSESANQKNSLDTMPPVSPAATPGASTAPTAAALRHDEPRALAPIPRSTPVTITNPDSPALSVPSPAPGY